MNIEALQNNHEKVMNCEVKDTTGLNDFQKLPNTVNIQIPRVGINRFRIPISVEHKDGSIMNHDAEAAMSIYLAADKTGANMSRFCGILQEEAAAEPINTEFFRKMLKRYRDELRDSSSDKLIDRTYLSLRFKYPVKQPSLKSGKWGWQYYNVELSGETTPEGTLKTYITLDYEYSSTCPCSLSMAKQYEQDYREGKITEGSGIASAHSQRSNANCKIEFDSSSDFHIEDLIALLRVALPTETQSLVKRLDEQAFAILNGSKPMFVEHASRGLYIVLESDERILDWWVQVEHYESLHSHNAVAVIHKENSQLCC